MGISRNLVGIICTTVGLLTFGACPGDETTPCGDQVCRQGFACDAIHDLCVVPSQLEVCVGEPDGAECFVAGDSGFVCDQEVCLHSECGDSILDVNTGEACDDGDGQNSNTEPDACRLDCQVAVCGDGVVDTGEECDDGNSVDTDDCRNDCTLSSCGDGMLDPGEECDDSALNGQTCDSRGYDGGQLGCGSDCHFDESACTSQCGNGLVSPAEGCDDDNLAPGDGCSEFCEVETGWECSGNPSICTPVCGDGLVLGDEACDDGNTSVDDGCGSNCEVETGWECSQGEPSDCTPICGDDLAVGAEVCDGADLHGQDCVTQTYDGGTLICQSTCDGFDTSGCFLCGDGICSWLAGETSASCVAECEIVSIATGDLYTCAVTSDGTAWCWGRGSDGQLGDGNSANSSTPVQVSGLSGAVAIDAGSDSSAHTCAMKSDGTVWCWGRGNYGQLGDGNGTNSSTPVQVSGLSDAIDIGTGFNHTCAVKSDGTAWCWGRGDFGQLGNGGAGAVFLPVQVNGLTGAVAIAAGSHHNCAVKSDGTAWCWGYGLNGRLGNGTSVTAQPTPVQVSGLTGVVAITAGGGHSCAVMTGGTGWCWGRNNIGQLGDGTTTDKTTPVQVTGFTVVVAISAGDNHTCAEKSDGTAWCWGEGEDGRLGNGSTLALSTPVSVTGLTSTASIAAGGNHSCATMSDGSAWCWGGNFFGELGDGTTQSSTLPVEVMP